jgi:hypothetical protein
MLQPLLVLPQNMRKDSKSEENSKVQRELALYDISASNTK